MSSSSPIFNVPAGEAVKVRIVDTTGRISNVQISHFTAPAIPGFDFLPPKTPAWSFLIEHEASGKKILFDLGIPKDYATILDRLGLPPDWEIDVPKDTIEVLEEQGIPGKEIQSIIWSHWHFDHIGNPATFPGSTELVVGQGFKEALFPGYPTDPKSHLRDSDFAGRELREINFETTGLKVGQFPAYDFFGDGSFYLLDSPGHAIGHLCALARTTKNPDTFIFMGGDVCHHGSVVRPSPWLPLPNDTVLNAHFDRYFSQKFSCPGSLLTQIQESRGRRADQAFLDPTLGPDIPAYIRSIGKVQEADADENVWFVFAHDTSPIGLADLFPKYANGWKEKGWAKAAKWEFLKDFRAALETAAAAGSAGSDAGAAAPGVS